LSVVRLRCSSAASPGRSLRTMATGQSGHSSMMHLKGRSCHRFVKISIDSNNAKGITTCAGKRSVAPVPFATLPLDFGTPGLAEPHPAQNPIRRIQRSRCDWPIRGLAQCAPDR
jgi:hypothetical protein